MERIPRDIKVALAKEIIERFHSAEDADAAEVDFIARFKRQEIPEDIVEYYFDAGVDGMSVAQVLKSAGLVSSTSEGIRMVRQGAVKIDGIKVEDARQGILIGSSSVYQVGKRRFAKITIN